MAYTYQNPDVYVSVQNNTVLNTNAGNPLNICLVGTASSLNNDADTYQFNNTASSFTLSNSNVQLVNSATSPITYPALTVKNNTTGNTSYSYANATNSGSTLSDYQIALNSTTGVTTITPGATTVSVSSDTSAGTFTLSFNYIYTLSGITTTQTYTTASIAYNATLATITSAINTALGITASNPAYSITAASVSGSGPYTFTYTATNTFVVGQSITVTGFTGTSAGYNGTFTVVTASSSGFTVSSPTNTNTTSPGSYTGCIATSTSVALSTSSITLLSTSGLSLGPIATGSTLATGININFYSTNAVITGAASSGSGPYTFTYTANNTFKAGQQVIISGITTATGFNGTFTVVTANATTFTVSNSTNTNTTTPGFSGSPLAIPVARDAMTTGLNVISQTTTGLGITANATMVGQFMSFAYNYVPSYITTPTLNLFNNNTAVQNVYGLPFTNAGAINSPISLAAQLAFANGASQVYTIASASNSASDIETAINVIQQNGNIDTIVPLVDYSTLSGFIGTLASPGWLPTYLNTQASLGTLQRAFIARDTSATGTQTAYNTLVSDAQNIINSRISVFAPTCLQMTLPNTVSSNNLTINLPGYYGAAAVAGVLASFLAPQEPLTHKVVQGFYTLPNFYTTQNLITMQANGILCLKQRSNGQIYIRHGLTTNTSSWTTEEMSIVVAEDYLYRIIKTDLVNSNLIGSQFTASTPNLVSSIVQGTLANALSSSLIQAFQGLTWSVPSGNPTQININFSYAPTFPLNYIDVTFGIDPSAGTIQYNSTNSPSSTTTTTGV